MLLTADQIRSQLETFTGTLNYYRYYEIFDYTDGIKFMAESCRAYWLLDAIASYQGRFSPGDFQNWILTVNLERATGFLTCSIDDGSGLKMAASQSITYTDFPLNIIELYCFQKVLYLPSEN